MTETDRQLETVATLLQGARNTVAEVTPTALNTALSAGLITLLLDVREREEWAKGRVPGAVHAPRGLLEWYADPASPAAMPAITGARAGKVVVACASGGRSLLAAETLKKMGYDDVLSLAGGFNQWKAEQFPVVQD